MKPDLTSISRFEIFWWMASDSPKLDRYAAKKEGEVERFSATHVRIHARPVGNDKLDDLEIILRLSDGEWMVKCDLFEDASKEWPFVFGSSEADLVWTYVDSDEIMVIRGCRGA